MLVVAEIVSTSLIQVTFKNEGRLKLTILFDLFGDVFFLIIYFFK